MPGSNVAASINTGTAAKNISTAAGAASTGSKLFGNIDWTSMSPYLGIASGALTAVSGGINAAQINDMSSFEDYYKDSTKNMYSEVGNSLESVLDTHKDFYLEESPTAKEIKRYTAGQQVGNALSTGINAGMAAGTALGPVGAGVGFIGGALASGIGAIIANKKANREADKLKNLRADAYDTEASSFQDNLQATYRNLQNQTKGNIVAQGGPLNMQYTGTNSPFGNRFSAGGININENNKSKSATLANTYGMTPLQMANRIFANKDDNNSTQMKRASFIKNTAKGYAEGGNLNNQFSDFRNGVTEYNAGGTHEENPNDGVQVGVDPQGTPNLVEEGEVNYNDYIFSERLKVPKDFKKKYGLGTSKKKMSYADAAKKLQKESEERPLDPISKRGLDAVLGALAESQEDTRFKKQMQDPQFRQQAMAQQAQQQGTEGQEDLEGAEEMPQEEQQPSEEEMMAMQQQAAQQGQLFAYGGRKGNMFGGPGDKSQDLSQFRVKGINDYDTMTDTAIQQYGLDSPIGFLDFDGMIKALDLLDPSKANTPDAVPYYRKTPAKRATAYNRDIKYHNQVSRQILDLVQMGDPDARGYIDALAAKLGKDSEYVINNFYTLRRRAIDNAEDETVGKNGYVSWDPNPKESLIPSNMPDRGINPAFKQKSVVEQYKDYIAHPQTAFPTKPAIKGLPTWMRYAPILTSAMGLFSKPNYSEANRLQAAVNSSSKYNPISGHYIGDYLKYTPYDINYTANQIRQQGNTQLRNIANLSEGNRAAAMASMATANYNTQTAIGNALRQAQEYNDTQRAKVGEFNSKTNQYNATVANQVEQFNAKQRQEVKSQYLNGMLQVAQMREKQQLLADQARSNAISGIGNAFGNIGKENFTMNQNLAMLLSGVYGNFREEFLPLILSMNGISAKSKRGKQLAEYLKYHKSINSNKSDN